MLHTHTYTNPLYIFHNYSQLLHVVLKYFDVKLNKGFKKGLKQNLIKNFKYYSRTSI